MIIIGLLCQIRLIPAFLIDGTDLSLIEVLMEEADSICPGLIIAAALKLHARAIPHVLLTSTCMASA